MSFRHSHSTCSCHHRDSHAHDEHFCTCHQLDHHGFRKNRSFLNTTTERFRNNSSLNFHHTNRLRSGCSFTQTRLTPLPKRRSTSTVSHEHSGVHHHPHTIRVNPSGHDSGSKNIVIIF